MEEPSSIQAIINNIFRLKDITNFAEVNRSTARYHLIREERSIKVSWGHYTFSDKNFAPVFKDSFSIRTTMLENVSNNF
jgi:hypothetical protein